MPDVDLKAHLHGFTERSYTLLVKDLKALPPEAHTACFAGAARAPLQFVAECAAINGRIAKFLSGVDSPSPSSEEREAFLASFDTCEKALAYLESETNTLYAAIEAVDPTTLGELSEKMFGRPMTKFAIAEIPGFHMMYHDGQLNYIQSLRGDTEMHW